MKNKKILALIVLLLIAVGVLVSGCSSSTPASTVTVTETEETFMEPPATDEDLFILAVEDASDGNWVLDNTDDKTKLEAGWAVCSFFDEGYDLEDAISTLVGTDPSDDEAYAYGVIIGVAATTLCPEYSYLLD
jgi:hypothetical protein